MKLILIPGLDGTGTLFKPFLAAYSNQCPVQVLRLKQAVDVSYREQAEYISEQKGNEEVVLLAESYGGMVAYEILRHRMLNVRHVIFAASFFSRPSVLSRLGGLLPLQAVKNGWVPKSIVSRILFGRYAKPELTSLFYKAINQVDNKVLAFRIKQLAAMSNASELLTVPCTYLKASDDNLVSSAVLAQFEQCFSSLDVKEIAASHFLLQTNSVDSCAVISEILSTYYTI